ncbi:GspE/PulE family protein, partial [Oleiphilus sp. HI0066]
MLDKRKQPLGELLIQEGFISQDHLDQALASQKKSGVRLGKILIEKQFISETDLLALLSRQLKLQFVDLNQQGMNLELSMQLPETMARRLRAIVLSDNGRTSLIGMADPMDLAAVDEIAKKLGHDVEVAVIRESQLLVAFDEVYKQNEEISTIATELDSELSAQVFDIAQLSQADVDDSDAPVVRLLQTIFEDAVLARASDVHIEPEETVIRIRRRVDGVLSETVMRETRVGAALVLRLKLMCGLNIS